MYKLIVSLIRCSDMLKTSTVAVSLEKLSLFRLFFLSLDYSMTRRESAVLGVWSWKQDSSSAVFYRRSVAVISIPYSFLQDCLLVVICVPTVCLKGLSLMIFVVMNDTCRRGFFNCQFLYLRD